MFLRVDCQTTAGDRAKHENQDSHERYWQIKSGGQYKMLLTDKLLKMAVHRPFFQFICSKPWLFGVYKSPWSTIREVHPQM